ncbi:MAG: DNA/RNA nuclease SfsA [Dictyoglomi bacterium]|nr:DNA/RNA nuclease SfsA [Dictyoglomota bacterium]
MIKLNADIGKNHTQGTFIKRINRFVAEVEVNGKRYHAHLHDSGRLGELLIPGKPIMLIPHKSPKTDFKVIAIHRDGYGWILLNSGMHRRIIEAILRQKLVEEFREIEEFRAEYKVGSHRIDFLLTFKDYQALMEVKGCTLFEGKTCLFPDAPTKRGADHVKLLAQHTPSFLTFLVCHQDIETVKPNCKEDAIFCKNLKEAVKAGVKPIAVKISYHGGHVYYAGKAHVEIP